MRYTLKEEVKFQRHIIVPKNMKTLDYLLSDNVDEKILEEGEILSILSKNGMNIEIDLIGTIMLELAEDEYQLYQIASKISEFFLMNQKKLLNLMQKNFLMIFLSVSI